MTASISKLSYKAPETDFGRFAPCLICQSFVEGGLEDLTEEEWTL